MTLSRFRVFFTAQKGTKQESKSAVVSANTPRDAERHVRDAMADRYDILVVSKTKFLGVQQDTTVVPHYHTTAPQANGLN